MTKFGHLAYRVLSGWDGAQKRAAVSGADSLRTPAFASVADPTNGVLRGAASTVQGKPPPPTGCIVKAKQAAAPGANGTAKAVTSNSNKPVKMVASQVTPYAGLNAMLSQTPGIA